MRMLLFLTSLATGFLPGVVAADPTAALKLARSGDFDTIFEARCAQDVGQPPAVCRAAVARAGDAAAVVVTFPNGFARTLTLADGKFLRGNPTMSGVGTDTEWRLMDGTYHIRVDDQRFELPARLVFQE
jgi:hypothetical protein